MSWEQVCATLSKIEQTRSRLDKQSYLRVSDRNPETHDELRLLLSSTYNFYQLYGVTLDEHGRCTPFEGELKFQEFFYLLDLCSKGSKEARHKLQSLYEQHPCKWFARITNRDLKCGMAAKTINNAIPNLIPEFSVQLAEPYDGRADIDGQLYLVEPKFDGIRALFGFFDGTTCSALSRNGKELFNISRITECLDRFTKGIPSLKEAVLDGELMSEDWSKTVSTVHTQVQSVDQSKLVYYVFDCIPLQTFPHDPTPLTTRKNTLAAVNQFIERIYGSQDNPECPIHIVKSVTVNNLDYAWKIARQLHQSGYEGAVVKHVAGTYQAKRTFDWMKFKFNHTADAKVLTAIEGTGRLKGSLGALEVSVGRITSRVGTGFDDEERMRLWRMWNEGNLFNKTVEITFQELSAQNSFRFPVYCRLRLDK